MQPGNTYTLRLLPLQSDKNPFFGFQKHSWDSFQTGEFVSVLSLRSFGEADPIASALYLIKKKGTDAEKEKAKAVRWSQNWYVNVYVVDDPTNPQNNGKVKILKVGKKVHEKFIDAIEGESAEEFGERVFDLSSSGVNFKLKVETVNVNGVKMNNYDNSRFTSPIDLKLTDEQCDTIYDSVHDIYSLETRKSEEELKLVWREHYLTESAALPSKKETASETTTKPVVTSTDNEAEGDLTDDEVDELLRSTTSSDVS